MSEEKEVNSTTVVDMVERYVYKMEQENKSLKSRLDETIFIVATRDGEIHSLESRLKEVEKKVEREAVVKKEMWEVQSKQFNEIAFWRGNKKNILKPPVHRI